MALRMFPGNQSTKGRIISILSERWPLSAKEIYNILKKDCVTRITYQAVYKAIRQLAAENIIADKNKKYMLDIKWIHDLKKFTAASEKSYLAAPAPMLEIGTGSSTERNAFLAGKEAAEKAAESIKFSKDIQLALVFVSVCYENDFEGLIRGIRSVVKNAEIAGCTSLGGELDDKALNKSVVVALFSASKEDFNATPIALEAGDKYYKRGNFLHMVSRINAAKDERRFDCGIIFFPGFTQRNRMAEGEITSSFVKALGAKIGKGFPLVGCMAGDDWKFEKTWTICGNKAFESAVVFVGIKTSAKFGIGMQHAYTPLDKKSYKVHSENGLVSEFSYNSVKKPATEVYSRVARLPQSELKKIIPSYIKEAISQNKNPPICRTGSFLVAFPILVDGTKMRFEIDFTDGEDVTFMKTTQLQMVDASIRALEDACNSAGIEKPNGALIFPCAIFDLILAKVPREIDYIKRRKEFRSAPVFGCYAAGEIGMHKGEFIRGNGTFTAIVFGE